MAAPIPSTTKLKIESYSNNLYENSLYENSVARYEAKAYIAKLSRAKVALRTGDHTTLQDLLPKINRSLDHALRAILEEELFPQAFRFSLTIEDRQVRDQCLSQCISVLRTVNGLNPLHDQCLNAFTDPILEEQMRKLYDLAVKDFRKRAEKENFWQPKD